MSRDMPFMAKFLVNRIKNDERIDIEKHWKVRIINKIIDFIKDYSDFIKIIRNDMEIRVEFIKV